MSNTSNLLPLPVKIDADPDAGFTKLIVGHSHFALNPRKGTVTTVSHQVVPITELLSSVPAQKALARKARLSDPCDDRRGGSKGERSAMKTFHVDAENRILALEGPGQEGVDENSYFTSGEELAKLTAPWPMTRLLAIWNGLPGVSAVRRFTSRAAAVQRIWKAVQRLEPPKVGRDTGSEADREKTAADMVGRKGQLIGMLQAAGGATLPQLMAASGWQAHSLRGFISGTLKKKMGLTVRSSKNSQGQRVYRIVR